MRAEMKPVNGNILVVDPIPFRGGSKVATEVMLDEMSTRMAALSCHVLTQDPASWPRCQHHALWLPNMLRGRESGIGYLLKQGWQTIVIVWLAWRLGSVTCLLAASGPGVDLCSYWAARLLRCRVVQLIHGPVGCSGLSARALQRASAVFYLPSAKGSLAALLARLGKSEFPPHWQPFINGLSEREWPTATAGGARILWAASLLRWKGLEMMLAAHQMLTDARPPLMICYLEPKGTLQPCSVPQPQLPDTHWYPSPPNLDAIRAQCGVFVSTSQQEPFGLSILEAMAAGLCVVIPADGAWWDQHLTDGVDCCKYQPNDPSDLARVLASLNARPEAVRMLGEQARTHALAHYKAAHTYQGTLDQWEAVMRWDTPGHPVTG